jgi:hypothetical protein
MIMMMMRDAKYLIAFREFENNTFWLNKSCTVSKTKNKIRILKKKIFKRTNEKVHVTIEK